MSIRTCESGALKIGSITRMSQRWSDSLERNSLHVPAPTLLGGVDPFVVWRGGYCKVLLGTNHVCSGQYRPHQLVSRLHTDGEQGYDESILSYGRVLIYPAPVLSRAAWELYHLDAGFSYRVPYKCFVVNYTVVLNTLNHWQSYYILKCLKHFPFTSFTLRLKIIRIKKILRPHETSHESNHEESLRGTDRNTWKNATLSG